MFLDLCGFTAWSSEREPSQVFQLLETLYAAFDELAKNMGVFKVRGSATRITEAHTLFALNFFFSLHRWKPSGKSEHDIPFRILIHILLLSSLQGLLRSCVWTARAQR